MTAEERKAEAIRKMYLAAVEVLQIEGFKISNKTIAHSLFSAATAMIIAHCKQEELIPDEDRLWFKDLVRVPLGNGYDCEGNFFFYFLETVFDEQSEVKSSTLEDSMREDSMREEMKAESFECGDLEVPLEKLDEKRTYPLLKGVQRTQGQRVPKTNPTSTKIDLTDDLYISEDELKELPPLKTPDFNSKK
jgi:hypothetical protein